MSKYIPVDKLIAEIERRLKIVEPLKDTFESCAACRQELIWMKEYIDSLQQEQPEVQNGKFVFPKYLYARTKDNKTIDMSYAPQDMTAVEYIRNDFVEQEQLEVELPEKYQTPDWIWEDKTIDQLAKEYVEGVKKCNDTPTWDLIHTAVCYGHELGLNARKL